MWIRTRVYVDQDPCLCGSGLASMWIRPRVYVDQGPCLCDFEGHCFRECVSRPGLTVRVLGGVGLAVSCACGAGSGGGDRGIPDGDQHRRQRRRFLRRAVGQLHLQHVPLRRLGAARCGPPSWLGPGPAVLTTSRGLCTACRSLRLSAPFYWRCALSASRLLPLRYVRSLRPLTPHPPPKPALSLAHVRLWLLQSLDGARR